MLRHEDDVTNQRLMWLLVVQGLLVNAYVPVRNKPEAADGICVAGLLITLSAFISLYKSYQARGYLKFLGREAKKGKLPEQYLRFDGWPVERMHGWRSKVWVCPWFERFSDILEPQMTIPGFLLTSWSFFWLKATQQRSVPVALALGFLVGTIGLFLVCVIWTWIQGLDTDDPPQPPSQT
jgi:hypothetical protein